MNKLLELLQEQVSLLRQGKNALQYSYDASQKILKSESNGIFTLQQQDVLEAFASRPARTTDMLVQKIIKTIHLYETEPPATIRDMLLQAKKKGIIKQAEVMFEIRQFRNEIAHDYLPESQLKIAEACVYYTVLLLQNVDKAILYCNKYPVPNPPNT